MTRVRNAFFYGTLMHPQILRRVIRNDGKHLKICPAILMDYTRHRIYNEDYPGIVPYDKGEELLNRVLQVEERWTRGTLVMGFTPSDMRRLDAFEDDLYDRTVVKVHPLEEPTPLERFVDDEGHDKQLIERIVPTHPPPSTDIMEKIGSNVAEADTYVYQDVTRLEPKLWSFADFLKDAASDWLSGARNSYLEAEPKEEGSRPFDRRIRMADGV